MRIAATTTHFSSNYFAEKAANAKKNLHFIFKKCEKGWSYVGKAMRVTQLSLGVSAIKTEAAVVRTIQSFKLIGSIGIPFTLANIANTAISAIKSIGERDVEGATLSGITFFTLSAELIDSIGTIVNTALAIGSQAAVQFFSVVSLPIGFAISGVGILTRSYQMVKTAIVFAKFKGMKAPKDYLQNVLQNKKELERYSPPETIKKFEKIYEKLQKNEMSQDELRKELDQIAKDFRKKFLVDGGNLFASFITLTGLILITTGICAPIGVALLAASIGIRLGLTAYSDFG